MAATGSPNLLSSPDRSTGSGRAAEISRVLARVFVLNIAVAAAKLVFGYATGTVSMVSDGFHSLTDSASNVMGLIGLRAAHKPPDQDHPYGHRKYETLSAAGIFVFLLFVVIEVVRAALERLSGGGAPDVSAMSFAVILVTLAINVIVVRYESARGRALGSELLLADAMHTRSDVLTSTAVLIALVGTKLGYPILDPIGGIVIAIFIARTGLEIARDTSGILSDRVVMAEDDIRSVVMSVPDVLGCHHIRTRGTADHTFLDLHVWVAPEMPLFEAHRISHVVKDRLMQKYPQIADAIIHIEPPPPQ